MSLPMTREQIYAELSKQLVELFEIDAEKIRPEAKLYEDLDLDSIDAVDMIVQLQKVIEKRFKPEDFKNVRTVNDVVDVDNSRFNIQNLRFKITKIVIFALANLEF